MTHLLKSAFAFLLFAFIANQIVAQSASGYHVAKTFKIQSSGGWDYIAVGPGNNRLYVSHGTQVNVLDQTTGDSIGVIPNTTGVHGIAFNTALGKGYTSNGRLNTVTVFELSSNKVLSQIATGQNPDAIMYDNFSRKIITCNGRSNDLSVIDPVSEKVVATIAVGGKPETAVSDGAGKIFVNIEDKNEIAVVNINNNTVEQRWTLSPAEGPTGLAIDLSTHRLFVGCEKTMVVMDATNGKIVDKITIGNGCDGVGFDPQLKYAFASCGEGVLSIVQEKDANTFSLVENVPTKRGARTIAVDPKSHNVYLPTADFEPSTGGGRPNMIPGTFQVLAVSKG